MALVRYASGSINVSAYCSGAPTQVNEQMAIMNCPGSWMGINGSYLGSCTDVFVNGSLVTAACNKGR